MKKLLIALALLFIPAAASAQCNGVFPNGTICGNSTGSSNTPRPTIATSFALGLTVGSTPIISGTTTAPLFNNAGILGNGLIASTWSTYTGFEATSARTVQAKLQDTFSVLDYVGSSGCTADAVSDCSTAFNAAVQAALDYSAANVQNFVAGTVYVPPGMNCYRIHSSTINLLKNISIKGAGEGSCILADDVDAITLNYVSGYGMPTISDLIIVGENATASRTAIKATGSTTSWLLPLYGLTVRNTMIYQFDVGISSQTVLTTWFQNDWLENINQCFDFIGWGGINTIQGVSCQRGATAVANGTAPNSGITLEAFTYSIGGSLQQEGTIIHSSNINGFATSVDIKSAVDISIDNTSLSATVDAVKTLNISGGLSIHNNYIALTGALGAHGFYALGTGSAGQNQTNIESNTFVSSTSTISNGIQINDAGLPGQANFNISKNFISGMGVHDIVAFGPSYVNIDGNFLNSSGTTDSINLGSATTNGNRITNNVTSKAIVANSSDLTVGATREAGNTIAGALQAGTWQVETNSVTSGQLMVGAGGGVQPTGLTTGTGVQTFLTTPSSANLAAALTDETGTGAAVFANGPTLIAPALGTPISGVATNLTGTAASLTAGHVTTNANLTGPITSSGNATSIAAQTGTGTTFAMSAGPTFTGTVQVTSALNAGVDGSPTSIGPAGTGALNGILRLEGSSATAQGAYLQYRKNSTGTWFIGHVSAIEAVGTSSDLEYFNSATSVRTQRLSSIDDSVAFASVVNATSGTAGAINTLGGIGVTKDIWGGGQEFLPSITTSSAAQTGTVCWTTGTGKFTVDTTVGCLTSLLSAKNITEKLAPAKALAIVDKLDPFAFRYKDGWGDSGHYEQFGLGAEEVAAVDERLIGRDPEGNLQGVRYQEMTAVLAGAIQQLKADNDNLRACNAAWKCRIFGWK